MKKLCVIMLALMLAILPACAESVGMANPWVDTDAAGMEAVVGIGLNVPEGAENVAWRVDEAEKLGELDCVVDGAEITARVCTSVGEFTDISGMYYEWTVEEPGTVCGLEATCKGYNSDEEDVQLVLWYDVVPGIMYSVSARGADLDGFDVTAIAEQVYVPAQGEAN